jgi:ClpP class serine protease
MFSSRKSILRIVLKKLDYNTALTFDKKLNNISPKKCEALFIDIAASASTGLTQSEDFVTQIQQIRKKGVPVYTFGNEAVIGPSLLVLLAGDYSYVDRNTLMGLFDFSLKRNVYNKFLNERNYQIKFVTAGQHKIRLNPFEEIKNEDKKWAVGLLSKQKVLFLEKVQELRGSRLKLNPGDLEKKLGSNFLNTEDAVQCGLLDGFHSVDTLRLEKFRKNKIKEASISQFELIKCFSKTEARDVFSTEEFSINEILTQVEDEFMNYVFDNSLKYDIRI